MVVRRGGYVDYYLETETFIVSEEYGLGKYLIKKRGNIGVYHSLEYNRGGAVARRIFIF